MFLLVEQLPQRDLLLLIFICLNEKPNLRAKANARCGSSRFASWRMADISILFSISWISLLLKSVKLGHAMFRIPFLRDI